MDLNQEIINQIREIANNFQEIQRILLFGSRARGDNRERSDIDLAVYTNGGITEFAYALDVQVKTLLKFDISNMYETDDINFKEEVEREGILLYEKP